MIKKQQYLVLKQVDRQLEAWQKCKQFFQPKEGWICFLRKTLGMTMVQFAKKLSVTRSRLVKMERAETEDAVTLRTLKAAAQALNCELIYAFVPRTSLRNLLQEKAEKIARVKIQRIAHSMSLENQGVESLQQQEQIEELTKKLLSGNLKQLWEEEE